MTPPAKLLEMRGITKRFPGVVALKDVSLELNRGEVLALMGENGAGKSTLMKILGGAYAPEEGQIYINGEPVHLRSIKEAKRHGIALIHQELMLAPNIDIAGNIFLGNEFGAKPGTSGARRIANLLDRSSMNARADELMKRVGLDRPPTTKVRTLTAGQMQMVEIAKALSADARIIIMDEPTSSLTAGESEQLFRIIHALRRDGIGVIYISHRMEEVLALSDRITVLRDGKYVGDLARAEASHERLVQMMVGRALSAWFPQKSAGHRPGDVVLDVSNVLVPGSPSGVSFAARKGEILGFAGLVGSGRTELMEVLFGAKPALGGTMKLDGKPYLPRKQRDAIDAGVYLAPEDRKKHGLVLPMSVAQNISLPDIGSYRPRWVIQRGTETQVAEQEVKRMRIKTPDVCRKVVNLSGGNQQKVVLGKWLAMRPKVLVLDEPTRGIDVGAKAEIYRHMVALAEGGITILMISSDMEEVIGLSDRVVVMHERRISGTLPRGELSQEKIGLLMAGRPANAGAA